MTQVRQRDARSRNVLKCLGYCIKQIDSIFAVGLYSDNAQRTSKTYDKYNSRNRRPPLTAPYSDRGLATKIKCNCPSHSHGKKAR